MNLQELKQKLEKEFSEVMYKCSELHDEFDRLFEQYEKENKQEPKIYESVGHTIRCDHTLIDEKIESMQKEIENIKGINGLNFESHAKRLNKIEEKLEPEPKQERFTFREYKGLDTINKIYDVLDSKNKLYFRTLFEYTQAKDVCENLNSLAKGE